VKMLHPTNRSCPRGLSSSPKTSSKTTGRILVVSQPESDQNESFCPVKTSGQPAGQPTAEDDHHSSFRPTTIVDCNLHFDQLARRQL
jgi:hypothetical protein